MDIDKIEDLTLSQIDGMIAKLTAQKRKLNSVEESKFIEEKKKEFDLIKGKNYWRKWRGHGNQHGVTVYKVLSCTSFGLYNSCNVRVITTQYEGEKLISITVKEDTHRVDAFPEYSEITDDQFDEIEKAFLQSNANINEILNVTLD